MAEYLVLIYGDEQKWDDASEDWAVENAERHRAFAAEAGDAILGGHELERPGKAVTLRGTSGYESLRADGPFMEGKEVLGGYYLLQAPDLDEAIRLAGLIPEATTSFSGVEVRPVRQAD